MKPDFSPVIWPEVEAPSGILSCQKCELHHQRSRVIWGEGNPGAPIIAILDNSGAREDKEGNPFICGSRQTLQLAAFETGLKMEDLYITYVLKCRPVRRYNKEIARNTCMVHLMQQVQMQRPKLAFCLGNVAVQWFFGDMGAEVKKLRGMWHNIRGIPTSVTYHPLAIRRRPNLLPQFIKDWEMLAARYYSDIPLIDNTIN